MCGIIWNTFASKSSEAEPVLPTTSLQCLAQCLAYNAYMCIRCMRYEQMVSLLTVASLSLPPSSLWGSPAPFHPPCCPTSSCPPVSGGDVDLGHSGRGTGAPGRKPRTGRCRSHWSAGQWALGWRRQATLRVIASHQQPLRHAWLAVLEPLVGHLPGALLPRGTTIFRSWPSCMFSPLITSGVIWNVAFFMAMGGREGRVASWAQSQGSWSHHCHPDAAPRFQLAFLEVGVYNPHSQEEPSHFLLGNCSACSDVFPKVQKSWL